MDVLFSGRSPYVIRICQARGDEKIYFENNGVKLNMTEANECCMHVSILSPTPPPPLPLLFSSYDQWPNAQFVQLTTKQKAVKDIGLI